MYLIILSTFRRSFFFYGQDDCYCVVNAGGISLTREQHFLVATAKTLPLSVIRMSHGTFGVRHRQRANLGGDSPFKLISGAQTDQGLGGWVMLHNLLSWLKAQRCVIVC